MEYKLNDEIVGRGNTLQINGTGITVTELNDGIIFDLGAGAGSGITELTGDVTAGPGSGSQAATIANLAITDAKVSATAAIAFNKLASLQAGNIIIGDSGNVATEFTLSKDGNIDSSGNLTVVAWQGKSLDVTTFTTPSDTGIPIYNTGAGEWQIAAPGGDATLSTAGAVNVVDLTIAGEATGDILYFNGTNWIKLAIGTAGQVLTVNGGATAPVWA